MSSPQTAETTTETRTQSNDKKLEAMKSFAEQYAKRTNTYFCVDPSVTAVVVEGLAKHKEELGAPLCPCRHYEDKEAEVKATYWNCPCIPMRERKECHCMLFLTPDNDFAGDKQTIELEEIKAVRDNIA
ncbi:MAG: ferredoxin--nitrite reductase [Symploca sp. SIO2E9]|nr:ferredoxin--nitrite reductase [Symploca sp. SIO2E9]